MVQHGTGKKLPSGFKIPESIGKDTGVIFASAFPGIENFTEEYDSIVAEDTYQVALVMEEECSGYFPGMYGYLDMESIKVGEKDTPPELLAYQDLLMRMVVTDRDGRTGSTEMAVTAVPDPADLKTEDTGMTPGP